MNETYLHHMECLLRVLVYIEEHLGEELALDRLAKIAHISPYYFHRLFHAYMGETLSDYVTRLRMQRATEKLNYTDTAVTDIAFEVGYETPSSFTKVFNQVMGKSPRAFRKSMRSVVEAMLERVPQNVSGTSLNPSTLDRKEEEVLFVRKVGPYSETPWKGFDDLLAFLKQQQVSRQEIKAFYSMGLDDPQFVPVSKCRFDACVALNKRHIPKGEVGLKTLPGGKCAVFVHKGHYNQIESFIQKIFTMWYPTANITLADVAPFYEHLDLSDERVPTSERTTQIYIPLSE